MAASPSRRRKAPAAPAVRVVSAPNDAAARAAVDQGLVRYNLMITGYRNYAPVGFFLKNARGGVVGGLHGFIWGGWMFVRMFWVSERLRGQGHGKRLLRTAEAHARKRGCVGAYLDTFSFQARPFYEQEGYRLYGTLKDSPVGHAHYYLSKRFRGVAAKPAKKAWAAKTPKKPGAPKRGAPRRKR